MRPEHLGALALRRLARDIAAELELLDRLADEVGACPGRAAPLGEEAAAFFAWKLHGWYTGLEVLLERIARTVEGAAPAGPSFPRDLLRGMTLALPEVRPAVLRRALLAELAELLGFRHFLRHAYAVALDEQLLRRHAVKLAKVAPAVRQDLERFAHVLLEWATELEVS